MGFDEFLVPSSFLEKLYFEFEVEEGFQSFLCGNFGRFLQFKVKIFKNSSKSLHFQLRDHFSIILSHFELNLATVSLIFEVGFGFHFVFVDVFKPS